MKVKRLRELIKDLNGNKVGHSFKVAVEEEFPDLLKNYKDDDELPLSLLQQRCNSRNLFSMFGILRSTKNDTQLKKKYLTLHQELLDVIGEIEQEFPDLRTYYDEETLSLFKSD